MKQLYIVIFCLLVLFIGQACEKHMKLPYQVHNNTNQPVKLIVQNPQMGYAIGDFKTDTIVHLQADSLQTVGFRTEIRSGFDSVTNWLIYDKHPGMQNFSLMRNDSVLPIANGDSNWFYKNDTAYFPIESSMVEYLKVKPSLDLNDHH